MTRFGFNAFLSMFLLMLMALGFVLLAMTLMYALQGVVQGIDRTAIE